MVSRRNATAAATVSVVCVGDLARTALWLSLLMLGCEWWRCAVHGRVQSDCAECTRRSSRVSATWVTHLAVTVVADDDGNLAVFCLHRLMDGAADAAVVTVLGVVVGLDGGMSTSRA